MRVAATSVWEQMSDFFRAKPIALALVLVFITFVLFGSTSNFEYLNLDDPRYVTENVHVTTGVTIGNIAWAFKETKLFYWHPLAWLSHMVDCQIFGLQSGPHHAINVLFHGVNAALLFTLLLAATGALWRSAAVAMLFAVHPLNVETVAWVSERKSLLSALFSFLALAVYGWYSKKPSIKRYLSVVALVACALMSKPMAVTLPILFFITDFWPLRRIDNPCDFTRIGKLALEKVPLLILSAASSLLTIIGQRSAMMSVTKLPIAMRLGQVVDSYVVYIGKLFWPTKLSPVYPYNPHWVPSYIVAAGALLLLAITAVALRYREKRFVLAGWVWFVLSLLPVIGIVQVGVALIADRFTYIPAIGIFCLVVWTCGELVERYTIPKIVPSVAFTAVTVALGISTLLYLPAWTNSITAFTRAEQFGEPHPVVEDQLSYALRAEGRNDEALRHSIRSCELEPKNVICHVQIGDLTIESEPRVALDHYAIAARNATDAWVKAYCGASSGAARLALGDLSGAERELATAQQIDPINPAVRDLSMRLDAARSQRR